MYYTISRLFVYIYYTGVLVYIYLPVFRYNFYCAAKYRFSVQIFIILKQYITYQIHKLNFEC